ncbi:Epimerase family protein SDR39U1 [Trichinella pseudospiralis]|uniref:Epimerase family protein SDR39U1 n=1 Tax=Trichinella pseudospiralis TaxID=6337 RepID=A0A0V1IIH1_TRIPS|nr:Epimerase family protein SDR39U1 [Trichinella pseudospiralis]KRZ39965.1 Epimerase family protein SDR39U1 [Trichinella pseudospiralis]
MLYSVSVRGGRVRLTAAAAAAAAAVAAVGNVQLARLASPPGIQSYLLILHSAWTGAEGTGRHLCIASTSTGILVFCDVRFSRWWHWIYWFRFGASATFYQIQACCNKPKTELSYHIDLVEMTFLKDEIKRNGLPSDCQGVVNLAGATIGDAKKRWTEKYKQEVYQSRIETTSLLAELLKNEQKNPKVFITASGIGYYPPGTSEIFTENSEVNCWNDYFSKLCQEWEIAGDLGEKAIHRRVTVRIGLVLGRNGGALRQMYLPFWLGLGGHLASGEQPLPWIHIDDLVGIFIHALMNSNVRGILNAVAPSMITNAEFTKAFGKALHRPTLFPVPEFALNFAFGKERAKMLIQGQKVKPQRTIESGYKFKYTNIYDAMKQIVEN